MMAHQGNVYAYNFQGKQYDTGDKLEYLKAVVEFALRRDDLGPEFREYLRELIKPQLCLPKSEPPRDSKGERTWLRD